MRVRSSWAVVCELGLPADGWVDEWIEDAVNRWSGRCFFAADRKLMRWLLASRENCAAAEAAWHVGRLEAALALVDSGP